MGHRSTAGHHAHTMTSRDNLTLQVHLPVCFWIVGKPGENPHKQGERVKLHTDINPSLYPGPGNCDMATLHTAPLYYAFTFTNVTQKLQLFRVSLWVNL